MTQPQINSIDIPYPSAQNAPERTEAYRGSGREMADGSVVFQWVNASLKHTFDLTWTNLSSTDMEKLRTAYATVAGNTSTTYKDVNGTTYNVTLDPQNMEMKISYVKSAKAILYNVTWTLRQV